MSAAPAPCEPREMTSDEVLRRLRAKHSLTQGQAAALARVSERTYQAWETAFRAVSLTALELLCIKLGEDVREVLGIEPASIKTDPHAETFAVFEARLGRLEDEIKAARAELAARRAVVFGRALERDEDEGES